MVLLMAAEIVREMITLRTKEALARRKAEGYPRSHIDLWRRDCYRFQIIPVVLILGDHATRNRNRVTSIFPTA
jgi:DNA invertase Pin-like site-specific DNA recombinase